SHGCDSRNTGTRACWTVEKPLAVSHAWVLCLLFAIAITSGEEIAIIVPTLANASRWAAYIGSSVSSVGMSNRTSFCAQISSIVGTKSCAEQGGTMNDRSARW